MNFYHKIKRFLGSLILCCISIAGIAQTIEPPKFYDTRGNVDVNTAGQLVFNLPIALPPGIKNIAPKVDLVYTSGASNGIAGYGWNIAGIHAISRVGKNIEKDGEMKVIELDYSDFYDFNGQRLILKSGEYGKEGAEYVTENFSNTKIKSVGAVAGQQWKGPEYWEVTFADGTQAWYGAISSGNSNARTPLEYNIVKSKDVQGNYITYTYAQPTGKNVAVISSIKWGGNETLGKPHFNEILFNYNVGVNRGVIEQSYLNGVSFVQDRLLSNIVVKTKNSQYRKYAIIYKTEDTKYQFVDKIQEYNAEDQPANPIEFIRQENRPNNGNVGASEHIHELFLSGDFRGMHRTDFIIKRQTANGQYHYYLQSTEGERYVGPHDIFRNAAAITIKDANGIVDSKQGIVAYSVDNTTRNLTITYYLIDFTKPANVNSLYVVATKVIPRNQWDESEDNYGQDSNYSYDKTTIIRKIISYDIDGDGVPEVLIEKHNNTETRRCTPFSENHIPTEEECQRGNYNEYKYIVLKQQDHAFPHFEFIFDNSDKVFFGDFNGDGISDIGKSIGLNSSTLINGETVPLNSFSAFNLRKNAQGNLGLVQVFSADFSGVSSETQIGDFNGDGLADLFVRTNVKDHYIINLNTGKTFVKLPYFTGFNATESSVTQKNGYYSVAKVLDINRDGKSDIVNFSSSYNITSSGSATSTYTIRVSQNEGYANDKIKFSSNTPFISNYNAPFIFRDIVGLSQNDFHIYTPPSSQKSLGRIFELYYPSNLRESPIMGIKQGNIETRVEYKSDAILYARAYKPIKKQQYPLMELENTNSQMVSAIYQTHRGDNSRSTGRAKHFCYRGLIINLHNKRMVGFQQQASSSWYFIAYGLPHIPVWSGIETDPLKEGVPVKEWSIRTKDKDKIFPTDISENNTQLLSFKATTYQIDKLLNGQVVTTIPTTDKAKIVTAVLPKTNRGKDFLTGNIAEASTTYGEFYLPSQTVSRINNSYAVTTSNYLYSNNPSGTGTAYYIGRPISKTQTVQAYGDTQSAKEEYTYENNLLKTLKTWSRKNTDYLLETYHYDGFGNMRQKVLGNSIDSQVRTITSQYDSNGRFVIKQTDQLGLETVLGYNDWGQVIKKIDPLGNVLTNTYNGWGKLISSHHSLEGETSYTYTKDGDNAVVTSTTPDGNISQVYTNVWGDEYKTKTKAFGQGKFSAKEIQYDDLFRKIKESEPYFEGQTSRQWNEIAYDDSVFPSKVTVTAFNGKQTQTSVSGSTTIVKEMNGYGRTTSKTADALGNIISTSDHGGTVQFSYNAAGEQIQAKYAENIVTTLYDSWGRKKEFNDPSNGIYKYEYDGLGQATTTISPKGRKKYTYNNIGQIILQEERSTVDGGQATNKTIHFTYNQKKMLTAKSGTANGESFSNSFSYDSAGRLLSMVENSFGKKYSQKDIIYDSKGRIVSYEKELQSSGMVTKVQIENVYSPWSGDLYQIKDKISGNVLWELQTATAKGEVLTSKLGSTTITNSYHQNTGFLAGINHSSQVKPSILQISYSFDALKNELKSRTTGGDFNIVEAFDYDENNRLINWTDPVTGTKPSANRNTYDVKGRITANDQVGNIRFENSAKIYQPTGMTLNAAGTQNYNGDLIQTVMYNENNDPVHIFGEKNQVAFQYGLGNMRQRVDITKKVSYGGEPISAFKAPRHDDEIWDPNNHWRGTFTHFYNEDGSFQIVRDQNTNLEKHILYIGGNPYDANIVYLKKETESSGSYRFLHKDYLGSILAISDEAGNKLEQRHYDAWGSFTHLQLAGGPVVTDKNTIANAVLIIDRGYTSHEHFLGVGIIHMNGRLYDPLLRRFLSADEHIQDPANTQNYNKYGYVLNNPLLYNDPSGEYLGFIIGFVAGSYISGVQANGGNMNPFTWDWKNSWSAVVGGGFAGGAIGAGIQNISVAGTKFIQNSIVGAAGSIFNGIANGQNVFKSAFIGFSGLSYSFNLSGNTQTSTDATSAGYRYIISPDYNADTRDYGNDGPHPFTRSEINILLSGGLITAATAKVLLSGVALEGIGAGTVATGAVSSSMTWGTFATVLTRALSIGALLSIKNDAPPQRYYVYGIAGKDEMAKFGVTKQDDPINRPQSQIPGLNRDYAAFGPHSWKFLKGPVDRNTAFIYEKYYVWAYTENAGIKPYAQKYPYPDAIIRFNKKH
ncbi:RHS repeat-associated core domain-containing protein [Chryseobacterium sp. MYb264]|uniref:RHS repeat-associated core domain-containing protein n=1 Tax=Chryseobacterium sp. MYb264 TaxID=2745153 RepID=UPI002E0E6A4E|nr:RHS repeat-associated core domain-containing protein [Chryseobacterium sp. MYb264]